jgi:hypothetical protein
MIERRDSSISLNLGFGKLVCAGKDSSEHTKAAAISLGNIAHWALKEPRELVIGACRALLVH